jgi:hypothetical protein
MVSIGPGPTPVTVTVPDVPVIDAVTVSVAVIVCPPAVFSTAGSIITPFNSAEFAGRTAFPSLLVKCTVPVYPVAVVFVAVSAVTVRLNVLPAVTIVGTITEKWVAAPPPAAKVAPTAIGVVFVT